MTRLKPGGKVVSHPARYSAEILVLARFLLPAGTRVHDPFAGTGERLGDLADERHLVFTGTELERPFIVDKRVAHGNACDVTSYPPRHLCPVCGSTSGPGMHLDKRPLIVDPDATGISMCASSCVGFTIFTSPVYPNGMADDYNAQERCTTCRGTGAVHLGQDGGMATDCGKCKGTGKRGHHRRTYRSALAKTVGRDVKPHDDNQARWGYRGTPLHSTSRAMYWSIARRSVEAWTEAGAERVLLNVSDFMSNKGKRVEPVVDTWAGVLMGNGWTIAKAHKVPTARFRDGANSDQRVDYEVVLDCRRS